MMAHDVKDFIKMAMSPNQSFSYSIEKEYGDNKWNDPVNHPQHYISNGIESIDVIEAFDLNFRTGNSVKYILRAGRKDKNKKIQDLEKAAWYLNREIEKLKRESKENV